MDSVPSVSFIQTTQNVDESNDIDESNKESGNVSNKISCSKRLTGSHENAREMELKRARISPPPKWFPRERMRRRVLKGLSDDTDLMLPRNSSTDDLNDNSGSSINKNVNAHSYLSSGDRSSSSSMDSHYDVSRPQTADLESPINTVNLDIVVKEEPVEPSTSTSIESIDSSIAVENLQYMSVREAIAIVLAAKHESEEPCTSANKVDQIETSSTSEFLTDQSNIDETNIYKTLETAILKITQLEAEKSELTKKVATLKEKLVTCSSMAVNAILERDSAESEAKMMKKMHRYAPSLPFISLKGPSLRLRRLEKILPLVKSAAGNCEDEDTLQKCYKEIIEVIQLQLVKEPERTVLTPEEDYNIFIKNGLSWRQRALIKRALIKLDLDILAPTNAVFCYKANVIDKNDLVERAEPDEQELIDPEC